LGWVYFRNINGHILAREVGTQNKSISAIKEKNM
jgi:hypothetical protein